MTGPDERANFNRTSSSKRGDDSIHSCWPAQAFDTTMSLVPLLCVAVRMEVPLVKTRERNE